MKKLVEIDGKRYLVPKGFLPRGEHKNIGNCYFCGLSVYASPGQAIKWFKKGIPRKEGIEWEEFPTHKQCRKEHKN